MMMLWWDESGAILACHLNRGGFEVPPPAFTGSMEIPDQLGEIVGAFPRFHRVAVGVLQLTEDGGQTWADVEVPPPPVPRTITRWQGRRWLLAAGLLESVEGMIEAGGAAARIDYGVEIWQRNNDLFNSLGAALFPNEGPEDVAARIDGMFREAAAIQ